jgi:hypothetical protein
MTDPYIVNWRHGQQENGASFADSLDSAGVSLQRMAHLSPTAEQERGQALTVINDLLGNFTHQRSQYDLPAYLPPQNSGEASVTQTPGHQPDAPVANLGPHQ